MELDLTTPVSHPPSLHPRTARRTQGAKVVTTLIKLIGGHYLMPDSREGGWDTGVGGLASSSQTVGSNKERTGATKDGS